MKRILLSLAAAAAIAAAAAPATAQPWRDNDRHDRHQEWRGSRLSNAELDRLSWRIDRAARTGLISWDEARHLRAELRDARPLARRVETGSARRWEVQRLERIVDYLDRETGGQDWRDDRGRGWRR